MPANTRFQALVVVDGYAFPEPSSYDSNTADIVDAGRNVNGVTIGTVVRSDVSKIDMSWNYLTVAQWAAIQQCFKPTAGGRFYNLVSFFDSTAGGWVTKQMYVSDRTSGMWRRDPQTGAVLGWVGSRLALIEV
jgi:hypothetical protein